MNSVSNLFAYWSNMEALFLEDWPCLEDPWLRIYNIIYDISDAMSDRLIFEGINE